MWTTVVLYCRVLLLEQRKINGKKQILYPRILKSADINTPRIHTGCFGYLLNGNSSLFGHEPQTRKNHQTCIKCSEHIGGYTNHSVFAENRYQRRDKVIFLRYWRGLFSQLTCSSFMLLLLGISFSYFADISKPDIKREDRLVPTSEALVPGRIHLHKSGREKKVNLLFCGICHCRSNWNCLLVPLGADPAPRVLTVSFTDTILVERKT